MAQPDEHQHTVKTNPNWVDIGTLIVLTVTLVVVGLYTREAHRQSDLIQQTFDITSRPLLSAMFRNIQNPKAGSKLTFELVIKNLGKSPTKAHSKPSATYSLVKIDSPPEASTEDIQLVWPNSQVVAKGESLEPITDGQFSDMRAGRGWLYLRAIVTYDRFHTAICTEYTIKPHPSKPDAFITDPTGLCADQKTNDAN